MLIRRLRRRRPPTRTRRTGRSRLRRADGRHLHPNPTALCLGAVSLRVPL